MVKLRLKVLNKALLSVFYQVMLQQSGKKTKIRYIPIENRSLKFFLKSTIFTKIYDFSNVLDVTQSFFNIFWIFIKIFVAHDQPSRLSITLTTSSVRNIFKNVFL